MSEQNATGFKRRIDAFKPQDALELAGLWD
jgi:hypothetical protein